MLQTLLTLKQPRMNVSIFWAVRCRFQRTMTGLVFVTPHTPLSQASATFTVTGSPCDGKRQYYKKHDKFRVGVVGVNLKNIWLICLIIFVNFYKIQASQSPSAD